MTSDAVRCRNGVMGRGRRAALTGVSFDIAPGQHVSLIGRNGAGKTTLLRSIAGLDPLRAGTLRWAGGPLPRGYDRMRAIGVLLQHEQRAPFTVREIVGFGLRLRGRLSPSQAGRVDNWLARVDLLPVGDRLATTLSGGEWQRVRLARAMVCEPAVLVLDEPTAHLDIAGRALVQSMLAELPAATATVIATHDMRLAGQCDRIFVISEGRVLGQLPPSHPRIDDLASRSLGAPVKVGDAPFPPRTEIAR